MKQKVLYVITKSNWGGAQRYVFDLATSLSGEKFDIAVALGGTGGKAASAGLLAAKLGEAGVRTIFVKSFMRDISIFREFAATGELIRIFWKEKPDVVHLNSSKAGILGSFAARIAGVKNVVFTAHGWPFRESRNIFVKMVLWLASYATGLLSSTVICVSEYDLAQAKKMPGVCAVRIYNGIDTIEFGSGEKVRSQFPTGVKITGTIGELTKNKNQQTLIEEAKTNPDIYVAIVGTGELEDELKRKIKEYNLENRVKLLGFIPASEALKGFDVFALPSLKEGLPYVLIEAKMAGLPIVANRTGGVDEILDVKDLSEFRKEKMIEQTVKYY
jgi:glycosyltransferase involved in cell wall biosynthesis